jgi:hypothetical protein
MNRCRFRTIMLLLALFALAITGCSNGSDGATGATGAAGPAGPAGATGPAGPAGTVNTAANAFWLTNNNPAYMITAQQGLDWHRIKASFGPTYAGSVGWKGYMAYIEPLFAAAGIIDVEHIDMPYNFYTVNDFPVDPGVKGLVSDGTAVTVASYGMTSGNTPAAGITAPMIYYDAAAPPADAAMAGKIVVFPCVKVPNPPFTNSFMSSYVVPDYLWRNDNDTFWPLWTNVPPSNTSSYHYRWNWSQVGGFATIGIRAKAAGMVVVYDMAPGGAKGVTQRSVYTTDGGPKSPYVNCPTLTLDRVAGAKVITDAKAGKTANLKLIAEFVPSLGKGYYGFLPGKNYGSVKDEWIVIGSHTDAMSLTEENGALGILGVINYFKNIPQSERPRTLMVYLDCRHFMPGGESSWPEFNYFGTAHHPELNEKVVATVGMEHMGELETIETGVGGNDYGLSGRVEASFIGVYGNNPWSVKVAAKAVVDNNWPRVSIQSNGTNEPGVNGGYMASVKAPMMIGSTLEPRKPGIGLAGNWPGSQTQTFAQLGVFDANLFHTQVAGMAQIIGELMLVEPIVIDLGWGSMHATINNLAETAFNDAAKAGGQKAALLNLYALMFEEVELGDLSTAKVKLQTMKTNVTAQIKTANATALLTLIDAQIAKL